MKKSRPKSGLIGTLGAATAIGAGVLLNPDYASAQETADTTSISSFFDKIEYRIGLGGGTNEEFFSGASAEYVFNRRLSAGLYGDYFIQRGNSVDSDERTEVTKRERQLVGPATYKERTDEITTRSEGYAVADAGLGATFKINDHFEIPAGIGAALVKENNTKYGQSTIKFERNMMPIGQEEKIEGERSEDSTYGVAPSFSAGITYNFPSFRIRDIVEEDDHYFVNNLSIGASFNRTSKENSFRANISWRF